MGYDIRAFITRQGILKEVNEKYPETVVIPLEQGFEMLLNTWHFCFAFPEAEKTPEISLDFARLNSSIIEIFSNLSLQAPVAYIEIDCFGGYCQQYGIVWDKGEITFGPELVRGGIGPANRALKAIGVKTIDNYDEFSVIGIANYRHIEEWYEKFTGKNYSPEDDIVG